MSFAKVALLSPPYASLSYLLPDFFPPELWQVGQRVAVPLGNGLRVGVVESVCFEQEQQLITEEVTLDTDESNGLKNSEGSINSKLPSDAIPKKARVGFNMKPLAWPLEASPILSLNYLELAKQLALRQTTTLGRILGNIVPAGLRTTQVRLRFFGDGKPQEFKLKDILNLGKEDKDNLSKLWLAGKAELVRTGQNPLDVEFCVLEASPPWAVRPAAKKQALMLDYLYEHGVMSKRKLYEALGSSATVALGNLVQKKLVKIVQESSLADKSVLYGQDTLPAELLDLVVKPSFDSQNNFFSLTPQQMQVFEPLQDALQKNTAESHLLFGVTGSGKTAIYLELARKALAMGRSVLLLAPEVALALKLWAEVEHALCGAPRFLFHGYQSPSQKENTFWELARRVEPCVVVGTRSALLLPLENVGLIFLDEEHDGSFKQDEGFTYQAKEVAWFRAGLEKALLVLGSATPDVKSFHAALEGRIALHRLDERVSGGEMPEVKLVPIPKNTSTDSLLCEESLQALNEVVERGEQAVILLNRRGYAPIMYCLSCNAVAKCPHCEIALAYHKGRERLLCHYCGYSVPYPSPCTACKALHFLPMGEGTEKLEEHLASLLPTSAKVLRLDRDSTRRVGSMEAILQSFARKEASVLVGTQMLSKGHHFPDVTLAIVADADLGLNLPDYRAAERTFQLLVQSSGRSGRGEKKGRVLIQTRDPNHYCWEFVRTADYEGFYAREIALRAKRRYPPFVRLALIRISYPMDVNGQDEVNSIGELLRKKGRELGLTVLGPAPAPLPFLQGRRRFHCLIKSTDWQPLRVLFATAREANLKGNLRITLDLDPVNML